MILLETQALTVRYGLKPALSNLSLRVPDGVVGLLGPNGAGKSTLFKTLLGFIEPSEGEAKVLEVPVGTADVRMRLGYLPEGRVTLPGLSCVESVALAGELGGLSRTDALARAHDVLWFTGLGEARYRNAETFSTGMRQRTKLAMALVHDPELLLLDEPTSGLDPTGRRQMLDLVSEIGDKGISVLLSTHLLHDVEQVCTRVVLLDKGRLVLEGPLDALRQQPGWIYEIGVRETKPGRFRHVLSDEGLAVDEDPTGLLRVTLREPSTRLLFESARAADAEIRHLRRHETNLEERFLSVVKG